MATGVWEPTKGDEKDDDSIIVKLPPAPLPEVSGYEILGELGRGGMGVVYKARQHGLGRIVALKMVISGAYSSKKELERFQAEGEAAGQLTHPNIVQVYEVGQNDGLPYFSLEYVDGGTLAQQSGGQLRPRRLDLAARL